MHGSYGNCRYAIPFFVAREAYLANNNETLDLSNLRFTLHEIRFTGTPPGHLANSASAMV